MNRVRLFIFFMIFMVDNRLTTLNTWRSDWLPRWTCPQENRVPTRKFLFTTQAPTASSTYYPTKTAAILVLNLTIVLYYMLLFRELTNTLLVLLLLSTYLSRWKIIMAFFLFLLAWRYWLKTLQKHSKILYRDELPLVTKKVRTSEVGWRV